MSKCLKGKAEVKKGKASFECGKCGALTDKKKHVCDPKKVKSAKGDHKKR